MSQNNAVTKAQVDPGQTLMKMINDAMPELKKVAPKFVNVGRMVQLALDAKMKNPLLANSSPESVLNFCMKCAQAGTDRVGAGGMWAVPYWNSKRSCFDMTPIPDWRLLVEKAKKAGAIKHAYAEAVYEADKFEYERGLNPILLHKPARTNRGKLVAVYAVIILPDDSKDFVVMDFEADIIPIRNRTNAWKSWLEKKASNPWVTDEAEQSKKTVLKRALKPFEGASIELTQLLDTDNVLNGYADITVTPPEPIAMPKAIETTATEVMTPPTLEASVGQQQAEPPSPPETPREGPSEGRSEVRGIVDKITAKSGKKKDGSEYTAYGVYLGTQRYGTFDSGLAAAAKALEKREVVITWQPEGEYRTLIDIQAVPPEKHDEPDLEATGKQLFG